MVEAIDQTTLPQQAHSSRGDATDSGVAYRAPRREGTGSNTDLTGLGEISSLLGPGTSFEGTLTFDGRVRIDGHLKGAILSEGLLIVGAEAKLEANIHVGSLIVRGGTIRGNITATRVVEVHPPSKVYGEIHAPQLMIDKGVVFEGSCTMSAPEPLDDSLRQPVRKRTRS